MLYMHGQTLLSRKDLHGVAVPAREAIPGRTEKWMGVNHGVLADAIVSHLQKADLEILKEGWYCNPKGDSMWGAVDIAPNHKENAPLLKLDIGQDAAFSMGIRHSNLGTYAVSFAVGARISVCSNGLFDGQFILKHRHTNGLDLDAAIDEGIAKYLKEAELLEQFVYGMQDTPVTDEEAAQVILNAKERGTDGGYVNWSHLEKVWDLWKTPPHDEFKPKIGRAHV